MRARLSLLFCLALLAACGKKPADRCFGVRCDGANACDPNDGQCKCGGEGGVVCAASQSCQAATRSCVNVQLSCASVSCAGGTSCDPADGQCKCGGSGGPVCGTGQICDPVGRQCVVAQGCDGVACPGNERCDPVDGQCKCGGEACGANQVCSGAGACVDSACGGVHCIGGTVCDPADGQCKCGGSLCGAGQACQCPAGSDGGCDVSAMICGASGLCAGVACAGGTTCDPADGQCKCGGPGGAVCGTGQSCDVGLGACLGGDRCRGKQCPSGESCDPEDGQCKCGGVGGQVCTAGQSCYGFTSGYACRIPCDPIQQSCAPAQACYFDETAGATSGFCATPGTKDDTGNPPPLCNSASDCARGFHCAPAVGGSFPGSCERYCAVIQGAGGCTGAKNCVQIGNGAPQGVGVCEQ